MYIYTVQVYAQNAKLRVTLILGKRKKLRSSWELNPGPLNLRSDALAIEQRIPTQLDLILC
jgi:hypothetical protein